MKKFKIKSILCIATSIALSFTMFTGCGKETNIEKQDEARRISVKKIGATENSDTITVSGNITPIEIAQLSFKLGGVISEVYYKAGDSVKVGESIAGLDPIDYSIQASAANADRYMAKSGVGVAQAQYEVAKAEYNAASLQAETEIPSKTAQAKAKLELTEATYNRIKALVDGGGAAQSDLDEIETKLKADNETYQQALDAKKITDAKLAAAKHKVDAYEAQIYASSAEEQKAISAVSKANNDLEDTIISSPFDGIVLKKIMNKGETVAAGYPIVAIGNTNKVYAEIGVPDEYINLLQKGQRAEITVYGTDGVFNGKIDEIGSLADSNTRSFLVKILLDNEDGLLKPGMVARATIKKGTENGLFVPLESVLQLSSGSSVYIYDEKNGTVKKRAITTGEILGDTIEITKGVKDGEQLVVEGQFMLHDGDFVQLAEEDIQ